MQVPGNMFKIDMNRYIKYIQLGGIQYNGFKCNNEASRTYQRRTQ